MTRRGFVGRLAAGAVAAGAPWLASAIAGDGGASRPNILLLMTDQHRADCLGCDGNSVIRTPHLDALAREGARFSCAYSSTPTCTPARSALLTGLSPWHHGMLGYGRVSNRYPVKMPQALRDAGYHAFGIGKMHWFPQKALNGFHGTLVDESGRREEKGFISDYHRWFEEQAPGRDPNATGIGWNDHRAAPYALPEELHPTRWTADRAVEFIDGYEREEPFFLKVSFARPHSPYDPPARFLEAYREDAMPARHVGAWAVRHASVDKPFRNNLWHGNLGAAQAARARRGYFGSISFIDEQIGRIVAALGKRGALEKTLILFTADHGDMTGDHHLWRKSYAYEGSARIPFLVRWPGGTGWSGLKRGVSVDAPVELRDVLPTFLDGAGATVPDGLDGRSVLPLLRGEGGGRERIDLEHDVCYSKRNHWSALADARWKYIFHAFDGSEQLFDLKNDPGEERDLSGVEKHADRLAAWRGHLAAHLAERGEEFVRDGRPVMRPKRKLYSPHYPGASKG